MQVKWLGENTKTINNYTQKLNKIQARKPMLTRLQYLKSTFHEGTRSTVYKGVGGGWEAGILDFKKRH